MTVSVALPRVMPAVVPAVLASAAVAQQIAYPLVGGPARDALTVSVVVSLAAVAVTHAAVTRGGRFAVAMLLVTGVPGFAAEVLGVHTGVPFGRYVYTGALGPRWFGVPLVVGLAWTMLAWPAVLAAGTLARSAAARVVVGAWTLAGTDLFLDPQLVHGGYWRWRDPSPHLPGVPSVPLSNLGGWLLVALLLSGALTWLVRGRGPADDRVPHTVFLWLYAGWVVALAGFGGQPAAAGWGALALAPVAAGVAAALLPRR